jgi:rhodanese-related sulfurtransferase
MYKPNTPNLTPQEAAEIIKQGRVTLLDVRHPYEVAEYSIKEALNIPVDQLPARMSELPKDKVIITTCKSGGRAKMAQEALAAEGYSAQYVKGPITELGAALGG